MITILSSPGGEGGDCEEGHLLHQHGRPEEEGAPVLPGHVEDLQQVAAHPAVLQVAHQAGRCDRPEEGSVGGGGGGGEGGGGQLGEVEGGGEGGAEALQVAGHQGVGPSIRQAHGLWK